MSTPSLSVGASDVLDAVSRARGVLSSEPPPEVKQVRAFVDFSKAFTAAAEAEDLDAMAKVLVAGGFQREWSADDVAARYGSYLDDMREDVETAMKECRINVAQRRLADAVTVGQLSGSPASVVVPDGCAANLVAALEQVDALNTELPDELDELCRTAKAVLPLRAAMVAGDLTAAEEHAATILTTVCALALTACHRS